MSDWPYRRGTSRVHWRRLTPLLAVLALAASPARAQDDFAGVRRIFLEKADCAYCHGWAGDGAGQGQSPGAAANLRQSKLDRDSLIMVISCGIPGKAMPHFDDQAYTDKRCYGYTGELRATGHILPDQYVFLLRCGFDTVTVPETTDPKRWAEALGQYHIAYQAAITDDKPLSLLRRHVAVADDAN